jgi:hypothetical protein
MKTFDHPDYFRRFIPAGPIPSPVLLIERTTGASLKRGDVILRSPNAANLSAGSFAEIVSDPGTNDQRIICHIADQSSGYVTSDEDVTIVRELTFGLASQGIPLEWLRDDSIRYYGKFDDQCAAYCWANALDMGATETAGNCSEIGWHASRVDVTQVNGTNYPRRTDPVLTQWPDIAGPYPAGYIVSEDDRGFVSVSFFDDLAKLDAAWSELRDAESSYYADEDEETEGSEDA